MRTNETNNSETTEQPKVDLFPKDGESKSAMIRRLHFTEKLEKGEIARRTGIRYQMVYNIIDKEKGKQAEIELEQQRQKEAKK